MRSKGLGDTIAKITRFFRIDTLVYWFTVYVLKKEDCGCERRRDKLNKLVPYKKSLLLD
jgi:hypothetical protein